MLPHDPAALVTATRALFENSLLPMLIVDDGRRYVDANRAACLLLRLDRADILARTIDDLTPPEQRADMDGLWAAFQRVGTQSGTFELLMPDGPRMRVDYSATANVEPGRHLTIFLLPVTEPQHELVPGDGAQRLSEREREVLTLIAMGESGSRIADTLGISAATVETHVRRCLSKLAAKNRAHAIAIGLQRGEIAISTGAPER